MDDIYISKVLKGDSQSFKYFVNTYTKYAFSLAYSIIKEQHLSEDAVQESFIKAFQNLKYFKHQAKFKTWFGRIVINESLKRTNTKLLNYKIQNETELDFKEEYIDNSFDKLIKDEQRFYISLTFQKLNPEESLALELFYLKEKSITEITTLSGWSASKTKMLLLRGRKHFYTILKRLLKDELKEIILYNEA